jgi:hypothetical protein
MSDSKFAGAVALKKAGMPGLAILAFVLASAGDIHDIFFDHTAEEAKAQAADSKSKAWEAKWQAFEAQEKLNLLAEQARMRIQFLEQRGDTCERNLEGLRNTVNQMLMQDRDNRNVPKPVAMRKPAVPKAMKPTAGGGDWMDEGCDSSDPLCSLEGGAEPPVQQVAPMPSLGEMWDQKKDEKKAKFKEQSAQ